MREEHPQIPIFAVGHSMVSWAFTNEILLATHSGFGNRSSSVIHVRFCPGWNDSPVGCIEGANGIRWSRLDGTADSHRSEPSFARQTLGRPIA
jgi:hypothetical protein